MQGIDSTPYQEFARDHLGFEFDDIDLLITAFTHRSYMNEHKKSARGHNERLEFLGDAVLGLVVCQHIYEQFPHLLEGEMTKIKSAVVASKAEQDQRLAEGDAEVRREVALRNQEVSAEIKRKSASEKPKAAAKKAK